MENERRIMRGASAVLSHKSGFDVEHLLPPQQAIITFLSRVKISPLRRETVDLETADGRVLAIDVVSDRNYPDAPRSTMDGYAIRAADVPATFRVVDEIRMGQDARRALSTLEAARIPTGGVLPLGADAVVPFERVVVEDEAIQVGDTAGAGDCITQPGEDMKEDELILRAGRRIGPPEIGVLATLGRVNIEVFARPRIGVISSGDELIDPGTAPRRGQIRDSNRYAIASALRAMGAEINHYPTARDREGDLEKILREAVDTNDAVVLSGGSSVGEHDRTPDAIAALGDPGVVVHGLRVKPGKPTVLAAIGQKPIIGLPGNPTSALMILETAGAPIIAALTGSHAKSRSFEAELTEAVTSRAGWTWFVPIAVCQDAPNRKVTPLMMRSSSTSLCARADGFIVIDEGTERLERGEVVCVHPFTRG